MGLVTKVKTKTLLKYLEQETLRIRYEDRYMNRRDDHVNRKTAA